VRLAYRGESYLPAEVATLLAQRLDRQDLSVREYEILEKIVRGFSNKEIAAALCIAEVTVKVHIRHLFQKLSVCDRTQAATLALQTGLVHLE
jgi:DNA-binding NarL/FixJ family response regulator